MDPKVLCSILSNLLVFFEWQCFGGPSRSPQSRCGEYGIRLRNEYGTDESAALNEFAIAGSTFGFRLRLAGRDAVAVDEIRLVVYMRDDLPSRR